MGAHHPCAFAALCVDRKSTRLNSSHDQTSYAVFCLKKKKIRRAPRLDAQNWIPATPRSAPQSSRRLCGSARSAPGPGSSSFFFFDDTATTEIYTLSLHDALPI